MNFIVLFNRMSLSRRSIRRIVLSARPCSSVKSFSQHNIYAQLEQCPIVSQMNFHWFILTYMWSRTTLLKNMYTGIVNRLEFHRYSRLSASYRRHLVFDHYCFRKLFITMISSARKVGNIYIVLKCKHVHHFETAWNQIIFPLCIFKTFRIILYCSFESSLKVFSKTMTLFAYFRSISFVWFYW